VNRALTVTAGIRWSLMPPVYEADGQQVSPNVSIGEWFNTRGALAQQGLSQQGAGRISFIPKDQGGRDLYAFHKKNLAPRSLWPTRRRAIAGSASSSSEARAVPQSAPDGACTTTCSAAA
jgi:hypothetical protein